jgi:hypothetical protein
MIAGVIVYARVRPRGTPLSWGEAALASVYVFALFFMAYGVVPHQWLAWADGYELNWRSDILIYGPGDILKPQSKGGWVPFEMSKQTLRDFIVSGIYGVFLAAHIALWVIWQNRGKKPVSTAPATSTFGRPLVKKA